jgi:rod shape determining protein RodA
MTAATTFSARNRVAPGAIGGLSRNPSAPWRHIDMVLVGSVAAVGALGCLMIFSATRGRNPSDFDTSFLFKQLLFMGVGAGVMLVVALVDYRRYRDLAPVAYGAILLGLLMVVTGLGSERKGSQAWFQIGPFQLQPSELAKIVVIVSLASIIAHFNSELDARRLMVVLAVTAVPMALIMLQPDLGTTLVFVILLSVSLLIGGAKLRHFGALALIGLIAIVTVIQLGMLEEYQIERVTAFLDASPDVQSEGYNLTQSKIAIASGGMQGKGLRAENTQTSLDFVPEQHTDFIFTAVGEQLGFVGSATLLALFVLLIWRALRIATMSRDMFGTLIAGGIAAYWVFQVFVNVGMTMGIMPITGIPLPFISYGGSSLLTNFLCVGLLLNIHMRRYV